MGGQRQALRKKPRANFTGRWVGTGEEYLAPHPVRSDATPARLSLPKAHQIRSSRKRSFG